MTVYINGVKASANDLKLLIENGKAGLEIISDVHVTKNGNLAVSTADEEE